MSDEIWKIKQNDTRPKLRATLANVGSEPGAVDLTEAKKVKLILREKGALESDPPLFKKDCTFVDKASGKVSYTWEATNTAEVGEFDAEFEIEYEDGGIESVPNDGYFTVIVGDDLG